METPRPGLAWPGPLFADDGKTLIRSVVVFMHSLSNQIVIRYRYRDGMSLK